MNTAGLAVHCVAVLAILAATVAAGAGYLDRYQIERPPVGVYTYPDILVMTAMVIVVPFLYLHLPVAAIASVFGVLLVVILRTTLQPAAKRAATPLALALLLADVGTSLGAASGPVHVGYLVVNDVVLALAVLGIGNLYVQSGMRAGQVALLAGLLAVYDYVATSLLPTTADLVAKLADHPFAPQIVVGNGQAQAGAGLGDALVIVLWTLAATKAFGRRPGSVAAGIGLGSIALLFALLVAGVLGGAVPAMVLIGPLIVVQYAVSTRIHRRERTDREWRAGVSPSTQPVPAANDDDSLVADVARLLDQWETSGRPEAATLRH